MFSRDNVGFQLWNMSKRISSVKGLARQVVLLRGEHGGPGEWGDGDLAELDRLTTVAEDLDRRADALWEGLQAAARRSDPQLIDGPRDGVSVIHNRGVNPEAAERVFVVWRSGSVIEDARRLDAELRSLLGRHPEARPDHGTVYWEGA